MFCNDLLSLVGQKKGSVPFAPKKAFVEGAAMRGGIVAASAGSGLVEAGEKIVNQRKKNK